jgi:hypothetical protein
MIGKYGEARILSGCFNAYLLDRLANQTPSMSMDVIGFKISMAMVS